eukprot:TRINITY_DN21118_c0_g1_i1.p1 TRINITY_DN21118_c0_g1~~TRINITY_DN21118_c0_g1_i1.p1  ORF type:complete len:715 (+),score=110.58 TRINITY_DN21118_c0_g1_i1:136-2145(+)
MDGAYFKTAAASAAGCCGICADHANCGHWVFDENDGRNVACHLKTGPMSSPNKQAGATRGRGALPAPSPPPSPAPKGAPNLLLLFPDQWRYDWDGLHPTLNNGDLPLNMPVAKTFAAKGVRFTQVYVPAPVCAPSRSCLASGRHYDRTQVPSNRHDYPPVSEVPTFYGLLRQRGYHTMTVGKDDLTKASQLGSKTGYLGCAKCRDGDGLYRQAELGFVDGLRFSGKRDVVQTSQPHEMYGFFLRNHSVQTESGKTTDAWEAHKACFGRGPRELCDSRTFISKFYEDDFTAASAVKVLRRWNATSREKPFFLHVSFPGPHDPFVVTAAMHDRTSDGRVWPEAADNPRGSTPGGLCEKTGQPDRTRNRCNYAAELENLDRLFGIIVDEVESMGALENTLVVVTSDHGEMLGDHGDIGKSTPWQASVSVPMIFFNHGVTQPGRVVESPVSNLDIVGTFLDFARVQPAEGMATMTLRSFLDPGSSAPSYRDHVSSGLNNFRIVVKEIQSVSYKYICCKGACPNPPSTAPEVALSGWMQMLIDVKSDEFDMKDLSAERPDIVAELRALLPTESYIGNFVAGCATINAIVMTSSRHDWSSMVVHTQRLGDLATSCGMTLRGLVVAAMVAASVALGRRVVSVKGQRVRAEEELTQLLDSVPLDDRFIVTVALPEDL